MDIKLIFQTITVFLKASESTEAFGTQELYDFDEDRGAQPQGRPSGQGWRRCPRSGRNREGRVSHMAIKEYLRRVFPGTAEEFCQKAGDAMAAAASGCLWSPPTRKILMHAEEDPSIRTMLLDEETAVVPDGISIVKAMNLLGYPAKERITGVDLAEKLLRLAGEKGKSVYLLGAKEEVVSALAEKLVAQYPQMEVRYKNGYSKDKDADFREIEAFQPDLVLVGAEYEPLSV